MAPAQPELKKYIDKRLFVQLNGSRKVIGVLRGYDVSCALLLSLYRACLTDADFAQVFLNIVLDEAVEEKANGDKVQIGMVVGLACFAGILDSYLLLDRSFVETLWSCSR
jgi:small nuclear ribonucleoprotein G